VEGVEGIARLRAEETPALRKGVKGKKIPILSSSGGDRNHESTGTQAKRLRVEKRIKEKKY